MPPQLTVGRPGPQYGGAHMYPTGMATAPRPPGFPSSNIYRDPIVSNPKDPGLGRLPGYIAGVNAPVAAPPPPPGITAPGSTGGAFGGVPDFSGMIGGSRGGGAEGAPRGET